MRMKKEHTQLKENQELQVVIADELMKMKLDDAITRIETLENDNKFVMYDNFLFYQHI